ncbi:unnamed protein product [Thelazia callipaeda]|uniref:TACC_C domain-containing protein n=1 Tax=Thelazia callipaeda TaxID=103827 RepID=A0A0N5D5S2_THECL|nr:unnamed protein product [Thelazia callipaeda]
MPSVTGSTFVSVMKLFTKKRNDDGKVSSQKEQLNELQSTAILDSKIKELKSNKIISNVITQQVSEHQGDGVKRISSDGVSKPVAVLEASRESLPSIDTRTITRQSKVRVAQTPEAVVAPLSKATTESIVSVAACKDVKTSSSNVMGQSIPTETSCQSSNRVPSPSVTQQTQISQQVVPPKAAPQVVAMKPLAQQQLPVKADSESHKQQQPLATSTPIKSITQQISSVISSSVPIDNSVTSTPSANLVDSVRSKHEKLESSRREVQKPAHVRQRTITLQSQVSLEIAAAYNEIKHMNLDDPSTELVRRIQAIVALKEKEWFAKNEKLSQLISHEQKRNEQLEQKAAERLVAVCEYEKLVKEFVDELKRRSSSNAERKNTNKPGPENNLSSDDVGQLVKERDHLIDEVNSLERTYGELFKRYEKLRQLCVEIKESEKKAKLASEEIAKKYSILIEKFDILRQNAEEQLDLANNEIDRMIKQHEADTIALRLKVRHQESKINSLSVSLEAKQKEVDNMTSIFEEVIKKAEDNNEEAGGDSCQ